MDSKRNYYQTLGVSPTATQRQVATRYRELARMFHPDIACGDKEFAQLVFSEINVAYSTLRRDERRKAYDAEIMAFAPASSHTDSHGASKPEAAPKSGAKDLITVPDAFAQAQVAREKYNLSESEELCRRILKVEPNHSGAHRLLGDVLCDRGSKFAALQEYLAASDSGDDSAVLKEKIHCLKNASRP
jgi:DnaJ-class molecular chaperone